MKLHFVVSFCALLLVVPASAQRQRMQPVPQVDQWHLQHYPFDDPNLPAAQRIDNLLSLMTVEEKIDCLGTLTGVPRLGVPNIGSSEGIHGVVQREPRFGRKPITTTQFPQPPGMGATWDPALVREAASVEGYEARFITQTPEYNRQILMLWGPQSDLDRDPRWGRSEEVYGEDPFFNGTMATAFVHGLQGDDPKYWQSAALLKHFLANENEDKRNSSSSQFDERLFWEYYSVPFRMAFLDGGAKAVMASYNAWNGTTMAINPILRSIVMDKWGVDVISSDGGAVTLLVNPRHLFPNQEAAVVACVKAGINQFLDRYQDEVKAALKDGSLTESDLDNALRRKFGIELKLGLLDPAGNGSLHQHQKLAASLGYRPRSVRLRENGAGVGSAAQKPGQPSPARQEEDQLHCCHRAAGRCRSLGLVWWHSALRRHSASGHSEGGRPRREAELRRL